MQNFENIDQAFKHAPMAGFVKKLNLLGLFGFLGLVIYYPILFFYLDPIANNLAYITLILFWCPLLPALPGLLKGNPYTFAWSNFVIMWCYIHGLTAIWTFEGGKVYIVIELLLLTAGFIGNTYFARYRGRELGMALPKLKAVKEAEKNAFENK